MHVPPPIVLASTSPYRRALLEKLGIDFVTAAPEVDEAPLPGESAEALVSRLAVEKARSLIDRFPCHLIIGSDQAAWLDGRPVGKPGDYATAVAQLRAAAGRSLPFSTAVCLLDTATGRAEVDIDRTVVHFRQLPEAAICRYVEREQALDCAGAFKSEGLGIALFERIETEDPNALIGLPLIRLVRLLGRFGVEIP